MKQTAVEWLIKELDNYEKEFIELLRYSQVAELVYAISIEY